MKKTLLSLMAISLIAVGCFSFAQEKDWIEYSGSDIIVYSPDRSYGIVIQDRNLGATMTGHGPTAATGSRGYHYQWGNNHGFESCYTNGCKTFPGGETGSSLKIDASGFGPGNYYSGDTFIYEPSIWGNQDWSTIQNDNLWGGEGDDETNGWGLTSNNPITGRQGPCPDGYHVPSMGELSELVIIWYNNNYEDDELPMGDLYYLRDDDVPFSLEFAEDMMIPFAGIRWGLTYISSGISYTQGNSNLLSSTPVMFQGDPDVYILDVQRTRLSSYSKRRYIIDMTYPENRVTGLSVRCFKNERAEGKIPNTLTLSVESGDSVVSTGITFFDKPLNSGQVLGAIEWLALEVELATGYHFAWYTETGGVETGFDLDIAVSQGTITSSLSLTGKIEPNKYTISFLNENGVEIMSGEFTYDQEANLPANTSTKEGYTFKGWKDAQGNTYDDGATVKNLTTKNGVILEFTPIWEKQESKPSGGSSGGGGRGSRSKSTSDADTHGTANNEKVVNTPDNDPESDNDNLDGLDVINYNPDLPANQQTLSDGLTPEMHEAYKWAYKNGITTMPTILEADMYGPLDRISMAKMLSTYAIKILGMTPDTSRINQFADVTPEMDAEFNNGVTLAYQLGIMGINMYNNEFRPFDLVPRSEFGTALSRMLYQLSDGEYEKTDEFYTLHFEKLKEEGIMTVLDPTIEELRGYVMIMLMRSAKKSN